MKKITLIAVIIAVLAAFAFGVIGCADKDEPNPPLEPVGDETGATLWNVVKRIAASDNVNVSEAMNLSFGGLLEINTAKGVKRLKYDMKANVNTQEGIAGGDNNNFYFRLNDADDDSAVLGIYADGTDAYLDLGGKAFKYPGVGYGSAADVGGNGQRIAVDAETIITLLGGLLFNEAKTNGDVYEFDYNIGSVSENVLPMLFLLAESDIDAFAEELGFADFNDMTAQLRAYGGKLLFNFKGDSFDGFDFDFNGNGGGLALTLKGLSINGGNETIDFNSIIPKRDYIVTKAINVKSSGEFYLESPNSTIAKYTWELLADIDPFNARGIEDNDDVFHLIVKNNTADNADDYNSGKIKATDGVVLELAYSPKQFNTDNLLIAVNLKSILSKDMLTSAGVSASIGNLLPEYFGSHIDLDALAALSGKGMVTAKRDGKPGILDILKMIKIDNGGVEIKRELITALFGDEPIIDSLLDTASAQTDSLKLNINTFVYGGDNSDYALKEHFLNVANDNGGAKNFGRGLKPSKSSSPVTDEGFAVATDIYGNTVNFRTEKISFEELNMFIGGKIKYTFTDFWGEEQNAVKPVKILGISGVDKSLIGQEQTITLLTSMPDGNNLMGLLNTFKVDVDLPTNVYRVKIILTESAGIEYERNYTDDVFNVGDEFTPDEGDCVLNILYGDGSKKSYKATVLTHNVPVTDTDGKKFINASGEYNVRYYFGEVFYYDRTIKVN